MSTHEVYAAFPKINVSGWHSASVHFLSNSVHFFFFLLECTAENRQGTEESKRRGGALGKSCSGDLASAQTAAYCEVKQACTDCASISVLLFSFYDRVSGSPGWLHTPSETNSWSSYTHLPRGYRCEPSYPAQMLLYLSPLKCSSSPFPMTIMADP